MRYIKCISVLFIGIFILSSAIPSIAKQSDDLKFRDRLILLRWVLARGFFGTPFFVLRFVVPETFTAEPSVISLKYLNQTDNKVSSLSQRV